MNINQQNLSNVWANKKPDIFQNSPRITEESVVLRKRLKKQWLKIWQKT